MRHGMTGGAPGTAAYTGRSGPALTALRQGMRSRTSEECTFQWHLRLATIQGCFRGRWEDALTCDASSWGFRRNADYSAYLPVSYFIAQLVEVRQQSYEEGRCFYRA